MATGLYGISFGALTVAAGLTVWQAMALSPLMFTGGSQFAFIGVIAGGGAGSAALGAAALLGVCNAVAAQLTIDESAATAAGQTTPDEQRSGFWTAGVGVFVLWNLFTLLGAVLGDALGDPRRWAWTAPPWPPSWRCCGRVCNNANPWRGPCCAAWSPPWPCRCCHPACPSCWPVPPPT